MVESFLKGGILMFSKEAIIRSTKKLGAGDVTASLVGGFGGGVAQVVVMGPCTYLVTAAVAGGDKTISTADRIASTFKTKGISGFYQGGTALMLRQGSNWASRQGFTDLIRNLLKSRHADPKTAKLSTGEGAVLMSLTLSLH
jgi:Mitochondrial carrier protein